MLIREAQDLGSTDGRTNLVHHRTLAPCRHHEPGSLPLGGAAVLPFHFAAGSLDIRLIAADAAAGRIELALSNLRGTYDMLHRSGPAGDRRSSERRTASR